MKTVAHSSPLSEKMHKDRKLIRIALTLIRAMKVWW